LVEIADVYEPAVAVLVRPPICMENVVPLGTHAPVNENVSVVPESDADADTIEAVPELTVPTVGVPPVPGGTVMVTVVRLWFEEVVKPNV
jgi:hypothetical protein